MDKSKLEALRLNEAEIAKCKASPAYYYNNYVRIDEKYALWCEEQKLIRSSTIRVSRKMNHVYPLTPQECFPNLKDISTQKDPDEVIDNSGLH